MPQLINKYCKHHTSAANVPTKKLRFSFRTAKVLLFSELCKFFSCFLHFSSQIHLSRPSIRSGVLLNDAFCARKFAYPKFLLYLCIKFSSYGIFLKTILFKNYQFFFNLAIFTNIFNFFQCQNI